MMIYGGYQKLPSHLKPSPPPFHPPRGIFPPKYDIFNHFEKGIKLRFSQEASISIGNYPMMIYGGYHKLPSYLKNSPPFFHPLRDIFPPKYDIFTHFEKESSSDSAKNQESALVMKYASERVEKGWRGF